MRIGHNELELLRMLVEKGGRVSFYDVKKELSGVGRLKWKGMAGYEKYHEAAVRHKSLVRASRTLEEKGLIRRIGYDHRGKLTRVVWLELTDKGRLAYLERV